MRRIVFQPIETPEGHYIYDRSVNTIFSVSPDEYEKFTQLPNDESIEQAPIILYYQHRGLLQPNDISVIQHPATAQAAGSI